MGTRFSSNKDYNRVLALQPRTSINLPNFQAPNHLHSQLTEELTIPEPVRYSQKNRREPPINSEETTPADQLQEKSENKPSPQQLVIHSTALTVRSNSPTKYHVMTSSAFIISRAIVNPTDRHYAKYISSTFRPFRSVVEHNGKQYLVEFEERIEKRYVQCMDETTQKARLFEVIDRIPCRSVRRYHRNDPFQFNNNTSTTNQFVSDFQSDQHSNFSPTHRNQLSLPFNPQPNQQYTPSYPYNNTEPHQNSTSPPSNHNTQLKKNIPFSSSPTSSSSSSSSLSHNKTARKTLETYNETNPPSMSSSAFSARSNQQPSTSSNERPISKPVHPPSRTNQYESTPMRKLSNITNQNNTPSRPDEYGFTGPNDRKSSHGSISKKPRYAPTSSHSTNKTKIDLQNTTSNSFPTKSAEYSLPNPRMSSKHNPSISNINAKPSFRTHTPTVTNSDASSSRTSDNFDEEDETSDDHDASIDQISRLNVPSKQATSGYSSLNSIDPFARPTNPTNQHYYRQRPNVQAYDEPIVNNPKFLQSKNPDYAPIPASIRLLRNNQYSHRNSIRKNDHITS